MPLDTLVLNMHIQPSFMFRGAGGGDNGGLRHALQQQEEEVHQIIRKNIFRKSSTCS